MTLASARPAGLIVAGATSLLLVVVLVLQGLYGGVEAPEGPWPPARVAEARLLPAPPEAAPGEPETVARPLFVPSRRPPPPPPVAPPVRIVRDQFQLQGTIVVGGLDIAMLREKQSGRVIRVEKGASVSDMTLAEIYPDRVVLKAGEETETLSLIVAPGAAPTPPFAAPTVAPPALGAPRPPGVGSVPPVPPAPGVATPAPARQPAAGVEEARRQARRMTSTW